MGYEYKYLHGATNDKVPSMGPFHAECPVLRTTCTVLFKTFLVVTPAAEKLPSQTGSFGGAAEAQRLSSTPSLRNLSLHCNESVSLGLLLSRTVCPTRDTADFPRLAIVRRIP